MIEFDEIVSCETEEYYDDEWVYDIQMKDDKYRHFFANDILIHNSLFYSQEPVFNSCKTADDEQTFVFKLYEHFINGFNNRVLQEYADYYGVENIQDFELEKYAESAIFLAKKKYIAHIRQEDSGNTFYDRLKFIYYKGVEMAKNSTPIFVRKKILEVIEYIFDLGKKPSAIELTKKVRQIKKLYEDCNNPNDIESISMSVGCNNYKKYVIDDLNNFQVASGCPIGVKSAAYHNFLLNKNPELKKKYSFIQSGEKVKYYYTKDPDNPIFGYIRNSYPVEFAPPINIDLQFEKTFLAILNRFNVVLGLPEYNSRLSVIHSLFSEL